MRALVLAIFPALLLGQTQNPPVAKASFEGTIVNAMTGEPLRKVRVSLSIYIAQTQVSATMTVGTVRQTSSAPLSVTTDNAGKFVFPELDPADYSLRAKREGFVDGTAGNHTGSKVVDPIILAPNDHRSGFIVKMVPYGAFAGRVVDDEGDPVEGLQISVMMYRYTVKGRELVEFSSSRTNDLGEYRVYNIPPGKYYLKAASNRMSLRTSEDNSPVYAPIFFPGAPDAASAQPFELAGGQQLVNLGFSVRRSKLATIRGKVLAPPDSHPSVGLMVVSENSSSSSSRGIDDKDGKFALFGIQPGTVILTGQYQSPNRQFMNSQRMLEVGTDDINNIELRPMPAMDVPGSVRFDGPTQMKPTELQFRIRGRINSSLNATPLEDGSLKFGNVQQDSYRLEGARLNNLYIKRVQWGDIDISDGEFDLNNGLPSNTAITVTIGTDPGTVEGVVTDDKGVAVDSARVVLVPKGVHRSDYYKSAGSDETGHFTLKGVPPGEYDAFAFDTVNVNAVMYDPDFMKDYGTAGVRVSVSPNDKKSVPLKVIVNKQK
jgi:hypothetical protein